MQGNVYVSEPLISKITGELSIMVAAPLYSGGSQSGQITGVVYFVPQETFLNDIVSSIKVAESSRAYMINKSGDTIADITLDTITTQNIEQEAQSNTSLKQLASIHADMRQGKNGFGSFQDSDGKRFAAYAPVGSTDGWSVAVTALKSEYLADTYFGFIINIIVIAASILASIVVALKLSSNISAPMHACARRMKLLVEGDLDSPVPQATGRDETAELTRSTAEMVNGLNIIINDISYLLTEMAKQNFDIQSAHREDYVGDFQNILLSMRTLKVELSNTIRQIDNSATQVSSASGQVSTGAQTLSQGSIEQASSIQELAATINDISESAKKTSAAAGEAGHFVSQAGAQLGTSVEYVKDLNTAMEKISHSSQEISRIIATIENIAFQTNILALNAAVEAARAGSSGKGFAVVAVKVKELAEEIKELANEVDSGVHNVENGTNRLSDSIMTSRKALGQSVETANSTYNTFHNITEAANSSTSVQMEISDVIEQSQNALQVICQFFDAIKQRHQEVMQHLRRASTLGTLKSGMFEDMNNMLSQIPPMVEEMKNK